MKAPLGAIDAKMTVAIAALLFDLAQPHNRAIASDLHLENGRVLHATIGGRDLIREVLAPLASKLDLICSPTQD